MTRFAIQRIKATQEALELIEELTEMHGPLALFQSGESMEGGAATCLTRAELLPDDDDVKLGEVGGAPFYINVEQYERWDRPPLVVDVAPGAPGGLGLEGLEEVHFVTRAHRPAAVAG
jgi:uncharacterized protein (DUF779 family)